MLNHIFHPDFCTFLNLLFSYIIFKYPCWVINIMHNPNLSCRSTSQSGEKVALLI